MSTEAGNPTSGVIRVAEANPHQTVTTEAAETISVEWTALVESIRAGDDNGVEQLYRVFDRGVRYYLARRLGPWDLDQKVHDVLLTVVRGVQRGELQEPERLPGFVRAAVRCQAGDYSDDGRRKSWDEPHSDAAARLPGAMGKRNPEWTTREYQRGEIMRRVLLSLSKSDRAILERFYVKEQNPAQICAETRLDETQFGLLKSRAKQLFTKFAQGENTKKPPTIERGQPLTRSVTA